MFFLYAIALYMQYIRMEVYIYTNTGIRALIALAESLSDINIRETQLCLFLHRTECVAMDTPSSCLH